MQGVRKFLEEEFVEVEGLEPAVDSASFTLMAWVRLKQGGGANVIRKRRERAPPITSSKEPPSRNRDRRRTSVRSGRQLR
jgi:hypothetical protein